MDDCVSCEKDYVSNSRGACDYECHKEWKFGEYLDIKNGSWQKRLIVKSLLECGDEILNTTETSHDNKKETCQKNNCLIYTISLLIIFTLSFIILLIFITMEQDIVKNKRTSYHINISNIKMGNNFKDIRKI